MDSLPIIFKVILVWIAFSFATVIFTAYWIHQATKEYDSEEDSQ